MSELEEKVERIEKLLLMTWKLAKAIMRGHNKTTKIFNDNFDVFEDRVMKNAKNIDKIVKTLQELVGESVEYDKEHPKVNIEDKDIKRVYI